MCGLRPQSYKHLAKHCIKLQWAKQSSRAAVHITHAPKSLGFFYPLPYLYHD